MAEAPIVPWEIAECVGLRLARLAPRCIGVAGRGGGRIRRVATQGLEWTPKIRAAPLAEPVEALVWISDGHSPGPLVRSQLIDTAQRCTGDVLIAEPVAAGCGVGPTLLGQIDPALLRLDSDELCDRLGAPRLRKPWEEPARWVLAQAAAWRFAPDAEASRTGFRTRLPRMSVAQLVLQCRRLQQRYGRAYELFALAAEELARRGDRDGVQQVRAELVMTTGAPQGVLDRIRLAAVASWGRTAA